MKLTPVEQERLLIFLAAELARRRRGAGLRLNHPEAVALISDELMEAGRAGRSYDEVRALGYRILSEDDVLEGVADMVDRIQIEPLFDDGTALVTLYFPIKGQEQAGAGGSLVPGAIESPQPDVTVPAAGETVELSVTNELDRAIQVTSHFHFFEVNRALRFDRASAVGMRLDVPAGLSVRFEPGETKTVRLRPYGGERRVRGFHNLVDGAVDDDTAQATALRLARDRGFADRDGGGRS
ncbi:MAG: urease subunit gamma/beta [Solirubrobacteraceae bacterium]|nr:urease subunit gamma/beta [Solirubrobacteraceae bacterium]